ENAERLVSGVKVNSVIVLKPHVGKEVTQRSF
ncbi:unnamed protein product, partial [marine sediment metagenome]